MANGVLLIAGMHRSGTSLVAQMMAKAGFHLGGPLLDTPRFDNLQGHWEHAEVVAIQQELLIALGRQWWSDIPLPEGWLYWPETIAAGEALKNIINRETAEGNLWVVKDPRLSRLLSLWIKILDELQLPLKTVLCLRNPLETAQSLKKRDKMNLSLALRIWSIYQEEIFQALPQGPDVIIDYSDVMNSPGTVLKNMLERLGLEYRADTIERASTVATPELRHHQNNDNAKKLPAKEANKALRLYNIIKNGSAGETKMTAEIAGLPSSVYRNQDSFFALMRAFLQNCTMMPSPRVAVSHSCRHVRALYRSKYGHQGLDKKK